MEQEPLLLLQQTTGTLLQAARYYVDNHNNTTIKARERVGRPTPGRKSFHAALVERLLDLRQVVEAAKPTVAQGDAKTSIRRTLDTFEALIRAKDNVKSLQEMPECGYAGLHALHAVYLAHASPGRRPRGLGHRKYLYCPPADMRARLLSDVAMCCQALRTQPGENGDADILSELETIREWTIPPSMLEHATRVRDVLLRHWDCKCEEKHREVKLAFTSSPKGTGRQAHAGLDGCYRLYWPTHEAPEHGSFMPLLHLIKDSTDGVSTGSNPARRKRNVRFVDPGEDVSSIQLESAPMQTFSTICGAVKSHQGRCSVRANEETVRSCAISADALSSVEMPMRSLRTLLVPGTTWTLLEMPHKQRIVMAVALAYAYLHLSDTAWWPRSDILPDFWFLSDPVRRGVNAGLPFLSFVISSMRSSGTISTEDYINPARPSLPAFGKLLLELWKGAPLKWGDDLSAAVAECELDSVGPYWLCAINACLGKEQKLKEEGALHESEDMRSVKVAANVWLRQLQSEVHPFIETHAERVKIAIIDTGVFFNRRTRKLYEGRVKEVRSFTREEDGEQGTLCPEGEDSDGHGTHATSVLLDIDPFSEVYVAKVFDSRSQKQGESLRSGLQLGVARAITHAIHTWQVQVISLSFGFEYQVAGIRDAMSAAERSRVLVLAAASNNGGNKPLSWPAREPTVFNIYATDGYGNSYERNPTQRRRDDNFAVLGSCVRGWWNSGEKVFRSGTSTATPIAAGIATLTIQFLRQHWPSYAERRSYTDEDLEELCQRISTYSGMRRIFRRMVDPDTGDRDGYCYLEPWLLFNRNLSKETVCENIISELRQV